MNEVFKLMKITSEKKFIYFSLGLLIASIIFLALLGSHKMNDRSENGWWSVYFNSTKDNSLDYTVENESKRGRFNWEIYQNEKSIERGFVDVGNGERVIVSPQAEIVPGKAYLIKIRGLEGTKEIYKQFK
jgi:hypothetical protein